MSEDLIERLREVGWSDKDIIERLNADRLYQIDIKTKYMLDLNDKEEENATLKAELAKWQRPFDAELFEDIKHQASHQDSLAAMRVYITALEHALKHKDDELVETRDYLEQANLADAAVCVKLTEVTSELAALKAQFDKLVCDPNTKLLKMQSEPVAYVDEALRLKWLIDHDMACKLIGTKLFTTTPTSTEDVKLPAKKWTSDMNTISQQAFVRGWNAAIDAAREGK